MLASSALIFFLPKREVDSSNNSPAFAIAFADNSGVVNISNCSLLNGATSNISEFVLFFTPSVNFFNFSGLTLPVSFTSFNALKNSVSLVRDAVASLAPSNCLILAPVILL